MALCAPNHKLSLISAESHARTRRRRSSRGSGIVAMASSYDVDVVSREGGKITFTGYEEGQLEQPKWVGETPLSRLVGALISFKPLYSLLKLGARRVLISTAEKKNIPWREMTEEILESDVYKELDTIQNPSIVYPHCFKNTQLNLLTYVQEDEDTLTESECACIECIVIVAAAEAEAATLSMARRAIPDASSLDEANEILRGNWLQVIEQHHLQYSGNSMIRDILDIGCSVGVSTGYLADKFPSAKVTGLDLSPYFLAVAQFKEKKRSQRKNPIIWIHANGEDTGLLSNSFDLVSMAFVLHECPEKAIVGLGKEAFRLLRPGGTIALTDNSPKSKILQELSPVLFTLMKSTEPFLDEYYLNDLEGTLREAGFVNIQTILTDPRHRTMTATVPH
uniref:Methyltransferase type 11 domain-containing protein n=1 Tax=Fagus sylvatica TaxID=28930 RepID=A0A2N9J521_FAGSY